TVATERNTTTKIIIAETTTIPTLTSLLIASAPAYQQQGRIAGLGTVRARTERCRLVGGGSFVGTRRFGRNRPGLDAVIFVDDARRESFFLKGLRGVYAVGRDLEASVIGGVNEVLAAQVPSRELE